MFVHVSVRFDIAGRSDVEKQGRLSCHCAVCCGSYVYRQVYELYYSSCTVLGIQTEVRLASERRVG